MFHHVGCVHEGQIEPLAVFVNIAEDVGVLKAVAAAKCGDVQPELFSQLPKHHLGVGEVLLLNSSPTQN